MGTTAEKLAYLKETKNQIKQALETPYNVMRDYPALIKKYIDNQLTNTVSDGNCVNALDVPLVSLGVDGNSYQGENPSPENPQDIEVIDGVNLFDKDNVRAGYRLGSDGTYFPDSRYSTTELKRVEQNTTYQTSWQLQLMTCICTYDNNENFIRRISNDSYSFTTTSNEYYIRADVSDDLLETAQITKGTTPKPYLPYGHIGLRHSNEDGSKSEVIPINLNGNSIAKVEDVKDLLKVYRNGDVEIKKNIFDLIWDGNSNQEVEMDDENNMVVFYQKVNDVNSNCLTLSNYMKHWNYTWNDNGQFMSWNGYYHLRLKRNEFGFNENMTKEQALEHFKEMLKNIPLHCYYTVTTPQTIELPSINPIELWEGTNKFELITNLDTTFTAEYVINKNNISEESTATEVAE